MNKVFPKLHLCHYNSSRHHYHHHQPSYLKEEKDKTREEHSFWCSNDCKSLLYYKEEQNESFKICNLKWYILYFPNFYFLRYITEIEYQNKMDFKLRSYFNAYFLH